jgi:hypothetical protein
MFGEMESRLDQWFISLPEELRYETTSRRPVPPPHILFLHIRYWGAVLLLNRALYVLNLSHSPRLLTFIQHTELERVSPPALRRERY